MLHSCLARKAPLRSGQIILSCAVCRRSRRGRLIEFAGRNEYNAGVRLGAFPAGRSPGVHAQDGLTWPSRKIPKQ